MVIASPNPFKVDKIREDIEIPIIDLSSTEAPNLIVKACEEFGFFKVINHGVSQQIISRMEEETREFFDKSGSDKLRAGPATPFGYGCRNIGLNGDVGELEYLLLQANDVSISQKAQFISNDPIKFSYAVSCYTEAVRELACQLLDLMSVGLGGPSLSGLIKDVDSDSVIRFNHYPPADITAPLNVGFGEHTDPQIMTLLRSNAVGGLQISLEDGVWVPVSPYPESAFCVNVGDLLQVMTNGRFSSVKHRAMVTSYESRTSMAFFAAPSLGTAITCLPGTTTSEDPAMYRSFTWDEYKKAAYTRRLGESRLDLFKLVSEI